MYVALYRPYQGFPSGGVYVDIPHGVPQRTIARLLAEMEWCAAVSPSKRCAGRESGASSKPANTSSTIR